MTTRTSEGGPSRDTLRSYIGAFLLGLKDSDADPDDVRAVLDELLPPAAGTEVKLGLIRHWPDGMPARVEKVWLDLPGFIIDYKLYDLSRVLAEFGFVMKVYEAQRPTSPRPGCSAGS